MAAWHRYVPRYPPRKRKFIGAGLSGQQGRFAKGTRLPHARCHGNDCGSAADVFKAWDFLKETVFSYIEDEALSRGAAIAFYTATSIAPLLLIVVAIAGLAFGQDAAQGAITTQFSGLMGRDTAQLLETAVANAADTSSGTLATLIGIVTLIATASGAFGEMQAALNAIWKAKPEGATLSRRCVRGLRASAWWRRSASC